MVAKKVGNLYEVVFPDFPDMKTFLASDLYECVKIAKDGLQTYFWENFIFELETSVPSSSLEEIRKSAGPDEIIFDTKIVIVH